MLFSTIVALLALPLAYAVALPGDAQKADAELASLIETNRVKQVEGGRKMSGAEAMAKAYAKYGWTLPTVVDRELGPRGEEAAATQTGSVKATDLPNDKAYYVEAQIGEQTLLMNMDSGSSDLWAFSTAMPKKQQGSHKLYQLEGHLDAGEHWHIKYAEGTSAAGKVYADKVVIGKVSATVQAVEAATSVSAGLTESLLDGIVGLAFEIGNTCAPDLCYTFMQNIAPTLPLPIFAARLRHDAPGEYDFGFIDKSSYTGNINYNSLTGNLGGAYWEFNMQGFSVGSGAKQTQTIDTIADTGTSLLLTDQAVVDAFYNNVPGAKYNSTYGGVVFPCSSTSKLQNLSFYINGVKHTMPGSYGVYLHIGDQANTCFGGVQANGGNDYTVMGDVFLKSQYVVFNVHTPSIGFAQQAGVKI